MCLRDAGFGAFLVEMDSTHLIRRDFLMRTGVFIDIRRLVRYSCLRDDPSDPSPSPPSSRGERVGLGIANLNQRNHRNESPPTKDSAGFLFAQQEMRENYMNIDFGKMDGLAPAVVQDDSTGEVLMLGFMNPESYALTVETGYVSFYSRTRQKLWMKGETSGNRLRVISATTDCDRDTLLFRVVVEGDGLVCHTGTKSCFTEAVAIKASGVSQ